MREALRKNLIGPMEMVMLTRERIEEVLSEAVDRGRMTVRDAQSIASGLVNRGRKQTNDVLKDLEGAARSRPRRGRGPHVRRAQGRRRRRGSGARPGLGGKQPCGPRSIGPLAQADRARRAAGVGPNFPIMAYDDLTADQVLTRLTDLTPAELRKVRDYERRNANRKTVLNAIESKLS